jgi:hypothetical protein
MITVYTLTFNEDILMQFMIDHYRSRFPNCHIVVYDNKSTDKTVEIAKANNCEIISYDSGGTLNDRLHMDIKNSCWKNAKTDWVLVSDLDEFLDINEENLKNEEIAGTTIIKSEGWQMVNMEDNLDVRNMKHGYRNNETAYDKCMLFNKKFISAINYRPGAHSCSPVGKIKYGSIYKMYHYKFINVDLEIAKCKLTAARLSDENRAAGWGLQRCLRSEDEIRADFNGRRGAQKILP